MEEDGYLYFRRLVDRNQALRVKTEILTLLREHHIVKDDGADDARWSGGPEPTESEWMAVYDGIDRPGDPKRMGGAAWRQMVTDVGLDVPELLGVWGYCHTGEERNLASPDKAKRGEAVAYAKETVDLAAEIGARFVELCAAQPAVPQLPFPEEPIATLRRHFKDFICEICEHASPRGITLLLEPLNCYEGIPGVLATVVEATNYVEELQLDNLGVQPDNYHMNIGEGFVLQAVQAAGSHIKHYHFNESNHCMHGTGHTPFKEIVRILKSIDYDGYLAFYMPQTSQQIFESTPGIGSEKGNPAPIVGGDKRSLHEYLAQPLQLIETIEQTVDAERELYDFTASRY